MGVITITTDFGHKGPFVAVMKGVILSRFPEATIVDLVHDIPAQWPPEAGFWVSRSYRWFPAGSIHLAIVDPGVGTERDILVVRHDGHTFMAPDNGLLGPLLDNAPAARVYRLDIDTLGLPVPSATFHGRDIFAPVAADMAAGRVDLDDVATETQDWIPGWIEEPQAGAQRVAGVVITVDTFGNLISNIDGPLLDNMAEPVVHIAGHQVPMRRTYGEAQPGEYLGLINSFGVVEVARAEGSAAEGLGTARGAPLIIRDGYDI